MMLTLTIDPQLFESPDAAFRFVTDRSCIGRTMQHLRRAGVLNGVHWFAVIEWQANGWPHWHLLVDADRIPFDVLARVSNRIVNEVPGINRVAYDITSKPPATIEWE